MLSNRHANADTHISQDGINEAERGIKQQFV